MKRIKIAPYGCVLHLTDSYEEWAKIYLRVSPYEPPEGCDGLTYNANNGNYYVGVFNGGLGTLAHELAHVCLDIAVRCGLGDIKQEQEQFCYLIGHMTDLALKALPQLKGS